MNLIEATLFFLCAFFFFLWLLNIFSFLFLSFSYLFSFSFFNRFFHFSFHCFFSFLVVIICFFKDISSLWEEVGIDSDEQKAHEFPTYFFVIEDLEDTTVRTLQMLHVIFNFSLFLRLKFNIFFRVHLFFVLICVLNFCEYFINLLSFNFLSSFFIILSRT